MINVKEKDTTVRLIYSTNRYNRKAIWFDMAKGQSQITARMFKQQLNSYAIVYEECPILNFDIIFVDEYGEYYSNINADLMNFSYLGDLMFEYLDEYLTINDFLYVEKCEIILLKPLKYHKRKKNRTHRRTNIPRGLKKEVFMRDNYTCQECGAKKGDKKVDGSKVKLHVDHIIPVSKGGNDTMDNLQTLCSDCNLNKFNLIQ